MSTNGQSADAVASFYDELAARYDEMTGFEGRFARERKFFEELVSQFAITTALDAGSGTGFHSFLLSLLGVRSTAVDSSAKMIARVEAHAAEMHLPVTAVVGSLADLASITPGPFDALFCMGNTLPHLRDDGERAEVLSAFHAVLRPGGVCIIQVLNYRRAAGRPVRTEREAGGNRYIRTHTVEGESVIFTLSVEPVTPSAGTPSTNAIRLFPLSFEDLSSSLHTAGFTAIASYGNISREPYQPDNSPDIIIIAQK